MAPVFGADAEWLEADGLGGFASGTASGIRTRRYHALLLAPGNINSSTTEALLHYAARAEHWEYALKPMLEKYPWVICDRFSDSTMAYQGYGGSRKGPPIGRDRIELIAQAAIPNVKPDLTFMMDLDPELGLKRASARKGETSSYELLDIDYHRRVREGFEKLQIIQFENFDPAAQDRELGLA